MDFFNNLLSATGIKKAAYFRPPAGLVCMEHYPSLPPCTEDLPSSLYIPVGVLATDNYNYLPEKKQAELRF